MADKENQQDTSTSGEEASPTVPSMTHSIVRSMFGLGLFAVLTAGLIAFTQLNTAERIVAQEKLSRSKALYEIVPLAEHDNALLDDAFWINAKALGLDEPAEVFVAKQNGKATTLLLPVIAPQGYTGPIRLIVGISVSGNIAGVRVLSHKETPGLGDKIEVKKSDWIHGFDDKSLLNTSEEQWQVKKDGGSFDQLTGATITPRAIVTAVYQALKFFDEHKERLLSQEAGSHYKRGN